MDKIYHLFFGANRTKMRCSRLPIRQTTHGSLRGTSYGSRQVRTSIQVSHLYLRALCEASCQTASECGRQAGGDDAFGVATGIFPSLQGLRPLRRYAAIP